MIPDLPPYRRDPDEKRSITLSDAFIWEEPTTDDAIYTTWNDGQFVCPRNAKLRMMEGVLAFTKTYPLLPVISESERLDVVEDVAALKRRSKYARGFILSSAWHVPLRWFSAFRPDEREVYDAGGFTSIRYRTSLGEAIDRVHWAVDVLDSSGFSEQVIGRVRDLEGWLTEFAADTMVELDYGEAAQVFSDADLAFDESAADVRGSLLSLEQGDFEESGSAYERVARRWAEAQAYTYSN
ncbi:MAG: hypothetical protein ACR2N2_06940 [Acidimicrobiia bacterium]